MDACDTEVTAVSNDPADDEKAETDGGVRAYTVRLELVDEPGELLRALAPIADNGGNLLSIHHERGSITPRGHIPVEVDLESPPDRFDGIVEALRDAGVNVIQAGAEHYGEEISVVLVGNIVETDLSDTLSKIESDANAVVRDLSLTAPDGTEAVSSARIRLAIDSGQSDAALSAIRSIGSDKELTVVEPLLGGETA
ncbi:amino acid-binding protein [Natronorubrum daqingense]|uniref:ACT domain-containing protein n=1 Tax=Natronorubrum daqingense TaxID=588898 RepID=A0A1N7CMJ2_9EURY|nr:amino acid-binding protein [Natronorubrum daqingense]APX96972.1 amino acid-binding protein [Natronorubrum daqingense]SIR64826.1 ACT domain-containing protein [Natronorubrum daqingense]